MDARVEHDTSLVRLLTRDIVARSTLAWSTLEINFLFPHIHVLRLFSSDVLCFPVMCFVYVRVLNTHQ